MPDVLLVARDVPAFNTTWEHVGGAGEAAQNIVETLHTPIGSLPWNRAAGSNLTLWLNAGSVPPVQVQAEIRRVALDTPGVIPSTVETFYDRLNRRFRLTFLGADGRQQLLNLGLAR